MDSYTTQSFGQSVSLFTLSLVVTWCVWQFGAAVRNIYFSPLSRFPGPTLAAASTYWKTYIECILNKSFHLELQELHAEYGPVVRVGPNELHFAQPEAYHDIYKPSNRWDKDESLYHSFGEDRSSFGFLTYQESKERKDVLGRSFSQKAVVEAKDIVQAKIDALCEVFKRCAKNNEVVNGSWAFRCMTMDIITYYCFGKSVDAIQEPGFKAPIIVAMDASLPAFKLFKHFSLYKNMIINCPRPLSRILSPPTAGLVDLQELLENQISEFLNRPGNLELLPHRMTIYHSLLDKDAFKNGKVPVAGSLYEEAQNLMFAGADTVGITLTLAMFYMLNKPSVVSKLKTELSAVFPDPQRVPSCQQLERLPYLNACIMEALRMSSGIVTGLPRIVPAGGARIVEQSIPEGTIVSVGSTFVHYNPEIFPDPIEFRPERWVENPDLEHWLVAFSKGPRSCLGINLAWVELRLSFATIFRRFDLELDASAPKQLRFIEAFLPVFIDGPVNLRVKEVVN